MHKIVLKVQEYDGTLIDTKNEKRQRRSTARRWKLADRSCGSQFSVYCWQARYLFTKVPGAFTLILHRRPQPIQPVHYNVLRTLNWTGKFRARTLTAMVSSKSADTNTEILTLSLVQGTQIDLCLSQRLLPSSLRASNLPS